jgi:hypothetical protein
MIKYNGTEYALSKAGSIRFYADENEYELIFLSSGGVFHSTGSRFDSITGSGNAFVLDLISADSTTISTGNYMYDDSQSYPAMTFSYPTIVLNFNFPSTSGQSVRMYNGSLNVKKSGSSFEVSYSGTNETGVAASLYYKGSIAQYNEYYK